MENQICAIEVSKTYVSLFVGYIYNKKVFTLDFIQRDVLNYKDSYYSFDEETVKIIKEMINKVKMDLNIYIKSFILVVNPKSLYYKRITKTYKLEHLKIKKDIFKTIRDYELANDKLVGTVNVCLDNTSFMSNNSYLLTYQDFSDKRDFIFNSDIFRLDADFYKKCMSLEKELNIKIEAIIPSIVAKKNITSFYNPIYSNFNILDLDDSHISYATYSKAGFRDLRRLDYGFDGLVSNFITNYKISKEKAVFLKNHYGYNDTFNYPVKLMDDIYLQEVSNTTRKFYLKILADLRKNVKFDNNPTFLFGDGANILGVDKIIKTFELENFKVFSANILGARNHYSYSLIGAVITHFKNNLLDYTKGLD